MRGEIYSWLVFYFPPLPFPAPNLVNVCKVSAVIFSASPSISSKYTLFEQTQEAVYRQRNGSHYEKEKQMELPLKWHPFWQAWRRSSQYKFLYIWKIEGILYKNANGWINLPYILNPINFLRNSWQIQLQKARVFLFFQKLFDMTSFYKVTFPLSSEQTGANFHHHYYYLYVFFCFMFLLLQ